jgi:hypothetical protein
MPRFFDRENALLTNPDLDILNNIKHDILVDSEPKEISGQNED